MGYPLGQVPTVTTQERVPSLLVTKVPPVQEVFKTGAAVIGALVVVGTTVVVGTAVVVGTVVVATVVVATVVVAAAVVKMLP
jgi:hypothetical protein